MANLTKLLDTQYEALDFDELANAPVEALAGVSVADAAALKQAFNVKTIGDLGRNKYIVAAVAIAALAGTGGRSRRNTPARKGKNDDLISRYIEQNPQHPGTADARLIESGVAVWALAGYGPLVEWDAEKIAADYALSLEEVEAALAYYHRHRDVIEARIAANVITAA